MDSNFIMVRDALLKQNYFYCNGPRKEQQSLKTLKEETKLENIIITIEKKFDISQYDFQYNNENHKFIRLNKTEDPNNYLIYKKCKKCSLKCFEPEYTVDEFIELCGDVFQPVSVRIA